MAEHAHSGAPELGAPMDYAEHRRTYAGFIALTKQTILATIIILVSLTLFSFGSGGFWLGTLLLLLMFGGLAIGLAAKGSSKPLIGVLVIGVLFFILSVA